MSGSDLNKLLEEKKLQKIELAKFLGESKQYVNSLIKRSDIKLEIVKKIAVFLKMPLNDLLNLPKNDKNHGIVEEEPGTYGITKPGTLKNESLKLDNEKLKSRIMELLEENRTMRIQINNLNKKK